MRVPFRGFTLLSATLVSCFALAGIASAKAVSFSFSGADAGGSISGSFHGVDGDGDGWVKTSYGHTSPDQFVDFQASGILTRWYFDISCAAINPNDCLRDVPFAYSPNPASPFGHNFHTIAVKTDLSDFLIEIESSVGESFKITPDLATVSIITDGRYLTTGQRSFPIDVVDTIPVPGSLALALSGLTVLGLFKTNGRRRRRQAL